MALKEQILKRGGSPAVNYYGIDIHKKYSTYTRVNDQGKIMEQGKIGNNLGEFRRVLEKDSTDGGAKAVIEATANWYYVHDLIEDLVDEVEVAHPLRTKAIASAKIKTDKIDATTLAQLLRANLIPQSYIPPPAIRELRELLRYRASLVRIRTKIKNKVHAILIKNGLDQPYSDLFGKQGRAWLEQLDLRPVYRMAMAGYLRSIDFLNEEIKPVTREIDAKAKADSQAQILESIPGIGHYSSMLIISEIGDIQRFPSASHLVSYAGLNPSVHSSGGITRYGRISKQGSNWLRWVMVEIAGVAARHSERFKRFHKRIAFKHGHNTANIALARKILSISYYLLRKGESYKECNE
jgi:transposase